MKTRLISLLSILMFSGSIAMAQWSGHTKMSVGILGGINFQNLNGKAYNGDKLSNDMILGYHAEVNVQIPIVAEFYFQPGLRFSTKGAKFKAQPLLGTTITATHRLSYLELPLNFVYKGMLGNAYVLLGFGPYLGYGIAGKVSDGGSEKVKFQNTIELGDDRTVNYYKALDAGANILAGYQMENGLFLLLETQLGMLEINPENKYLTKDKTSLKNTGFGLSIGYRF